MNNTNYLQLIHNWQTKKCYKSRNILVLETMNLINSVVRRFNNISSSEDLVNEGVLGSIAACNTFSSARGVYFFPFAKVCILNHIRNYLRLDHVIPKGSRSMHSSNLTFFAMPSKHSEIEKLAQIANVSYETAKKHALMGSKSFIEELYDEISEDPTYDEALKLEQREQLLKAFSEINILGALL